MLSYKICNRLKDAGFPQKTEKYYSVIYDGYYLQPAKEAIVRTDEVIEEHEYTRSCSSPNLSELIKACCKLTDKRFELHRSNTKKYWYAMVKDDKDQDIVALQEDGKSPETATSKLYLKLCPKKPKEK